MPSRPYRINFSAPGSQIAADCKRAELALLAVEKAAVRANAAINQFGASVGGINAVAASLGKAAASGNAAATSLRGVGQGNRGIASLNTRLTSLNATLGTTATAAGTAAAGLRGVGGGTAQAKPGVAKKAAGSGVGDVVATGIALMAGKTVGAGVKASEERRAFFEEGAEKLADVQEKAKEYASLMKRPGPDARTIREITTHARAAGAGVDESIEFLKEFEGGATFGRDEGNIGGKVGVAGWTQAKQDALTARLKVVGAQFGTRTGIDAKTAGGLSARVLQYKFVGSDRDLAGELGGLHYGLDQGVGDVSVLARGVAGQAGSTIKSGQMSGLPELGAWGGVISGLTKSPSSVGTSLGMVDRLLNTSGKQGGAAFLKEIGADKVAGDFEKLGVLKRHLDENKVTDIPNYLKSKGFGNTTDVRMTTGVLGMYDTLGKRIEEAKAYSVDGTDVLRRNAENQLQPNVALRRARAEKETSQVEQGLLSQPLQIAMEAARSRMANPNQPGGQQLKAGWMQTIADVTNSAFTGFGRSGEDIRVEGEAIRQLIEGGKAVGVDVAKEFPDLEWGRAHRHPLDPETIRGDFRRAAERVQGRGGDPFGMGAGGPAGGGAPQKAAAALRKAANELDKVQAGDGSDEGAGGGVAPGRL